MVFDRLSSRKDLPAWSRDEIRKSVPAIYQAFDAVGGRQHYRTAFLLHYDLRLLPPDAAKAYKDENRDPPRFIVYSIEIGAEGKADSIGCKLHDSLEAARTECVHWVGQAREVEWSAVPEMASIGFFNAVRVPGSAEFYDSFDSEEL